MFEVYKSLKGRKQYLVFDYDTKDEDCINESKRYFKCGADNLTFHYAYLYKRELYLDSPGMTSQELVKAISHWRKS